MAVLHIPVLNTHKTPEQLNLIYSEASLQNMFKAEMHLNVLEGNDKEYSEQWFKPQQNMAGL